jgi:hypothetical protein
MLSARVLLAAIVLGLSVSGCSAEQESAPAAVEGATGVAPHDVDLRNGYLGFVPPAFWDRPQPAAGPVPQPRTK